MNKLLLRGGRVLLPQGWSADTDVRVEDGLIERIGRDLAAPGARVIDATGKVLVPGFVDLHCHGGFGFLCEDGSPEAIRELSACLPRFGVTGFLATVAALPPKKLLQAIDAVAWASGTEPGARLLGIHLEGPFLNRHCAGAQNKRWLRPPDIHELDELLSHSNGLLRMITLAPELPGAVPLVATLSERGVIPALGHSEATEEETLIALEAGARHVVHLFNAMRPFHHREPGLVGVALSEELLTIELIADGHHVHPRAFELAWRARDGRGIALVTDSVAAGLPEGDYTFAGRACRIESGVIRLKDNGRLAGSCLTLDQAVRNVCSWLPDVAHERVFAAVSDTPCKLLGLPRHGRIEVGCAADLVLLDPAYQVECTVIGGRIVYERSATI